MLNFVPGVSKDGLAAALEQQFGDKYEHDPELRDSNQRAVEIGYELIKS
jgi:hypothetical protein